MNIILFSEAFDNWKKYLDLNLKPQSSKKVLNRFELHVLPYFKDKNIYDLNINDIILWKININNKNYKYKYKKAIFYSFVTFVNFCVIFYGLTKNVVSQSKCFKNTNDLKKEYNIWNYEEYKQFLSVIDDYKYYVLFDFMYSTGCRLGETLALTFDDLNNDMITINKTITKEYINGSRLITTPKTKKSNRIILIDNELKLEICKLKKYYKSRNINCKYIFGGDKPLSPTTINRKKVKYCKLSKVKEIRIHDLRHSHATLLINNNVPIEAVANRLGHSDINLTYNTYIHNELENEKRVLNTLSLIKSI